MQAEMVAVFGPDKLNATTITGSREGYGRSYNEPKAIDALCANGGTLGLKWRSVGTTAPSSGRELTNGKLAFALKRCTDGPI